VTATAAAGVSIQDVVKRYGDTVALAGLSLQVEPGEILGVAGPNGAGKSTLIKVLAGEVRPDSGTISVRGEPWTAELGTHRIAVVHQDPQLFPNLTVAENLLAGREPSRTRRPHLQQADRDMLEETGLLRYADHVLGDLPLALQQRTEIARALVRNADVFLFDEPNSALTEDESEELFTRMHALADSGRMVVLVTHRLPELAAHADRVAVIVDGSCRTILARAELSEERLARELVVGRVAVATDVRAQRQGADVTSLLLENWTHASGAFHDIRLSLTRGEIVAVVGVEGSGGRELVRSVAHFEKASGSREPAGTADEVAFVAADRANSLFDNLSVAENLYIRQSARIRTRGGLLKRREAETLASEARRDFLVKTAALDMPIRSLSGGNQQKVAIASALALDPDLVVLEEPTRGVDVSSKAEIYRLLRAFAKRDRTVLLYCTEDSEVFDVADRAVVISRGRTVGELDCTSFTDAESLAGEIAGLTTGVVRPVARTAGGAR
jgi:ABC-type sugar transport system ATPase subunit